MSANQKPDYRPAFVTQRDGSSLASSNCRMASAAMGLDFETRGAKTSSGAKMRSYTDDQSGGTDSGDAKQAWDRGYDQTLTVRDGGTFDQALADLRAWRAVHLDIWAAATGQECLSGSGDYGHTVIVLPDYTADGWAVGDPWCTGGYGRIPESKLRKGAETWGSEVYGRAAEEPDYPTDGPGPRDPRVLAIVARIVRRFMSEHYPGGPPGELRHADTGGGSILFTVTHPLEGDVIPLYSAGDRKRILPAGTDLYDAPGGTKTGDLSEGSAKNTVFRIVAQDKPDKPGWWLIDGGGEGASMKWVKAI
jgi:hypothetical protein